MIIIALIAVAVACVVVAWLAGSTALAYTALALSALGLATLGIRLWRHWKDNTTSNDDAPPANGEDANPDDSSRDESAPQAAAEPADTDPADHEPAPSVAVVGPQAEDEPEDAVTAVEHDAQAPEGTFTVLTEDEEPAAQKSATPVAIAETPTDMVVHVVPGRMRFHNAGCRLLTGHDHEKLTIAEAREEQFTPCTLCTDSSNKSTRKAS